jgi:hypothetical protein
MGRDQAEDRRGWDYSNVRIVGSGSPWFAGCMGGRPEGVVSLRLSAVS